ncbi:phosphotransferase family protein [Labedaea rhizosphaerae]|uniref:Phosphotransferase family enzyme n=1 Tax=Labedaea rhizosphaerae TaxID=598644 RepID=A0A4R6RY65_LABRH|nr:phosphotransferase [Labedaea rhizosphaerae]TDP92040.1 phosphotransferase family enzyme [Labedaea rhizosphaerae]
MRELAEQAVTCWRGEPGDGSIEVRASGGNGVVLRAERDGEPLAIKLSPIDERERGQREHDALAALAGSGLAPEPIALVVAPSGAPVTALITSWVDGKAPGPTWADAYKTAEMLAVVHEHTPKGLRPPYPASDAVALLRRGKRRLSELPAEVAAPLHEAADRLLAKPTHPTRPTLVHCDASPPNLLVTPASRVLVDWEYSGLGDPALDHAYLCAHPTSLDVFAEHPERCDELAELLGGTRFALTASVLYWTIIHEILIRTPQPRLAGARQRDPAALHGQVTRYRAWFQRLA